MTVVVLALEPLAEGVLPRLPASAPVDAGEALTLYRAMARDAVRAVEDSGGDLLVNYPAPERAAADDPEAAARDLVADAGVDPAAVRFEVQAGSSHSARAGNAVTHLLEREGADTAAVVTGNAPLLSRTLVDSAAMRLRRHDVVLGPAERGRVHFAGFAAPVDFAGAFAPPALPTLARRAREADLSVDFLPHGTRLATGDDLRSLLAVLAARRAAGRRLPEHTAAVVDELGLELAALGDDADGDPGIERR